MFKDDWVKYGFGLYGAAPNHFIIDYRGAVHDGPQTPLELAQKVAWELHHDHGPLTVMLSGGVDSQACAYAFKTAGVPVRFVMARYNNGMNDHDILSSEEFYTAHGIEREIIDVDILSFHENELRLWAERYFCTSPHLLSHMRIAAQVGGAVVFSGCVVTSDDAVGRLDYQTFALERYRERSDQPVIGYFFSYDPALHAAFSALPSASRKATNVEAYSRKCAIYREGGFPVIPQVSKLHGFEKVKEHYDGAALPFEDRIKYKERGSKRPYDFFFRFALEDLAGIHGIETITLHRGA